MNRSDSNRQRIALVTGASRGVGAATALRLAAPDIHILVNYREKAKRASTVVQDIIAAGGSASALGADVSDPAAVARMLDHIHTEFGRLDVLVLNASGGLERHADPGYALRLNRDAQVHLATHALPLMPVGGRIVFVTSHQAHFHGRGEPLPPGYEPVAAGKRAGEHALRAFIPDFTARGVEFVTVSGDMLDGTIVVRLLERRDPAAVATRRSRGPLPSLDQFAEAVVHAVDVPTTSGHTFYVGGHDYLSGSRQPEATTTLF